MRISFLEVNWKMEWELIHGKEELRRAKEFTVMWSGLALLFRYSNQVIVKWDDD